MRYPTKKVNDHLLVIDENKQVKQFEYYLSDDCFITQNLNMSALWRDKVIAAYPQLENIPLLVLPSEDEEWKHYYKLLSLVIGEAIEDKLLFMEDGKHILNRFSEEIDNFTYKSNQKEFTREQVLKIIEACQELHPKYWEEKIQSLSPQIIGVELEMEKRFGVTGFLKMEKWQQPKIELINGVQTIKAKEVFYENS